MRKLTVLLLGLSLLCGGLLACDDEAPAGGDDGGAAGSGGSGDGGSGGGGGGSGSEGGSGGGGVCAGLDTPHQQLLNAATEADVVTKVPTHPPIGPEGLP
jgi:hypothetical protein